MRSRQWLHALAVCLLHFYREELEQGLGDICSPSHTALLPPAAWNVLALCNRILSIRKERGLLTRDVMNGSRRHHAEWNKPITKGAYGEMLLLCGVESPQCLSHARHRDRRYSRGGGEGKWGFLGFGEEFQTCVHMEVSSYIKTGTREWGWWWLERLEGERGEGKRGV